MSAQTGRAPLVAASSQWKVQRDPRTGCELWAGNTNAKGYGVVWRSGRASTAYQMAWEEAKGPVPSGLELDHWCRRRACVAVAHLEPVTHRENERRKTWRARAAMTRCPAGHDLKLDGLRTEEGGLVCLVCSGVRDEARR